MRLGLPPCNLGTHGKMDVLIGCYDVISKLGDVMSSSKQGLHSSVLVELHPTGSPGATYRQKMIFTPYNQFQIKSHAICSSRLQVIMVFLPEESGSDSEHDCRVLRCLFTRPQRIPKHLGVRTNQTSRSCGRYPQVMHCLK